MQGLMDFSKRAIFISVLLTLPGCGNKGPLYLPTPRQSEPLPQPPAEHAPSPEAGDQVQESALHQIDNGPF